jgi:alpha-glucosidase (family GH31 glycosyl hydrolase)
MDAAIDSLRKKNFPLDGMAMDLQWYGTSFNNPDSSTMGSLQWDLKNFPQAPRKCQSFAK